MRPSFLDFLGLLIIGAGTVWGFAFGLWVLGNPGGLMGVVVGAALGFRLADDCALTLKWLSGRSQEALGEEVSALLSPVRDPHFASAKRPWFTRLWRKETRTPPTDDAQVCASLEEIHRSLKRINARLWKELRNGVLASCHAGLYSVHVDEAGELLDWREVNRRTVSALRRFETATREEERCSSLKESMDRIGQKLFIVQRAAIRKSDTLAGDEKQELQRNEAELWRLSQSLRFHSLRDERSRS
jgi:hypothetical protein